MTSTSSAMSRVTPLAGVWIETARSLRHTWNIWVTPLAGVWIETKASTAKLSAELKSLPLRECGLKQTLPDGYTAAASVTPLAGVWIETRRRLRSRAAQTSHSPCGSVD